MYREGHHGLNALLYAPLAPLIGLLTSVELALIGAVIMVGLSSVPDFDRHFDSNMNSRRSNVWQLVPISHRGFTHTIWFALMTASVTAGIALVITPVEHSPMVVGGVGFALGFLGVVGHILGDIVTPMGVTPFTPVKRTRYSFNLFKAANPVANYVFLILGGSALLGALGWCFSEVGLTLGL